MNKLCLALCLLAAFTSAAQQTQPDLKTSVNPVDNAQMVFVPSGEFLMGSTDGERDYLRKAKFPELSLETVATEMPQRKVQLVGYWIYRREVTVEQWRAFCKATSRCMPDDGPWQDGRSIANVTWFDAAAYARWAGGSLPTEAQWERAARGTDGRRYPWGADWDNTRCISAYGGDKVNLVEPRGMSPSGCYDMVGSMWEWCSDWWTADYHTSTKATQPRGAQAGTHKTIRGASWATYNGGFSYRCAFRNAALMPGYAYKWVGLRVVMSDEQLQALRRAASQPATAPAVATTQTLPTSQPARAPTDKDFALVKQRLVQLQLKDDETELARLAAADQWLRSLQPDGTWKDVDWKDQNVVSWQTAKHLDRVLLLAKAYRNPASKMAGDKACREATIKSLDAWLQRKPRNPNWWWTEIWQGGVMGSIVLLLDEHLGEARRKDALAMMLLNLQDRAGANMVNSAMIQITRGCLAKDPAMTQAGFDAISGEIAISDARREPTAWDTHAEGMQPDGSFFQHGRILYNGGYGCGFVQQLAGFVQLGAGTAFELAPERRALLDAHVLDGSTWMIYRGVFDYSAIGREITRERQARVALRQYTDAAKTMAAAPGPRQKELQALLARLDKPDTVPALVGNKAFWCSDFMVHRRPTWYASVKMASPRVRRSEMVNGEGKLSYFLSDGACYIMTRGDEYADIFGVWDWQRVPGTTVACSDKLEPAVNGVLRSHGASTFAGSVSDGRFGLAAQDFQRASMAAQKGRHEDKTGTWARKAWFFFDDEIVCLGAGITSNVEGTNAVTTLNQCFLRGDITVSQQGTPTTQPKGLATLKNVNWLHHDNIAYVFPKPTDVMLSAGPRSGSWSDSGAGRKDKLTQDVFTLWLDHGASPKDQTYACIIIPDVDAKHLDARLQSDDVEIKANKPACQAVTHKGSRCAMAAFYEPGGVRIGGLAVAVDSPCLVMLRSAPAGATLTVSDPTHQAMSVRVWLDADVKGPGARQGLNMPFESAYYGTTLTIELPRGVDAGKSVTVQLEAVKQR